MGIRRGSISTPIIADGLILNMDAANRASYPAQRTFATAESGSCYNTLDLSVSGSFISDPTFITLPTSASCWVFDGVDDYIEVTNDSSLAIPNTLTVSCWAKTTSTANEGIAVKGTNNGDWAIVSGGGATSEVIIFLNNGAKITGTVQINNGNWHHIAFTYDSGLGSNNLVLYVDGSPDGTANFTTALNDTAGGVNIGRYYSNSYGLEGEIANTQMYNRGLSASEVLHNYNALKGRFA